VLLDVERVAPCMPGATLDSVDGDEIRGRIKVKVGPINMTYAGTAKFVERDETAGVVRLEATGKETRGAGTASATVRSVLEDRGDETHVTVLTTLNVTGRPAQFGRGVMNEVGGKLLSIFATNLATTLSEPDDAGSQILAPGATASETTATPAETSGAATAAGPAAAAAGEAGQPAADLGAPLEGLNLPVRAASSLSREGIVTVGQLAAKTRDELLTIDGIGPASVEEIKARLSERGLALGQSAGSDGSDGSDDAVASGTAPTSNGAAASHPAATSNGAAAAQGAAEPASAAAAAGDAPHPTAARAAVHQLEEDSLNLLKVAGIPVLKRALPALAGLAAALLIVSGLRKRMKRR
jgi:carbon monoxide dehydrogenase subunit G